MNRIHLFKKRPPIKSPVRAEAPWNDVVFVDSDAAKRQEALVNGLPSAALPV